MVEAFGADGKAGDKEDHVLRRKARLKREWSPSLPFPWFENRRHRSIGDSRNGDEQQKERDGADARFSCPSAEPVARVSGEHIKACHRDIQRQKEPDKP